MGEAQAEAPAQPPARRLAPGERRALLIGGRGDLVASHSYTQAGLAEVASLAGVSKTLLYHYFPDGRPELYREVMDRLVAQVVDAVRTAARMPTRSSGGWPTWWPRWSTTSSSTPTPTACSSSSRGIRATPAWWARPWPCRPGWPARLNELLAASGQPVPVTMAGGAAAMGAVLHVCELAMAGQVTAEQAVDLAQRFVAGGLGALDLI